MRGPTRAALAGCGDLGFSLVELLIVTAMIVTASTIGLFLLGQWGSVVKSDGALRVVTSQLIWAREMAITQRHYMDVTFTNTNQVQIIREEVPGPATTLISSQRLEGNAQFALVPLVPDTPDAFGNASAVSFGTATTVRFSPDGMLLDQAGASVNGSVFVSVGNLKLSARAATILGAVGRVRGYKWNGTSWGSV
jgi:Tfp pilus assembly protein FimT